MNDAGRDHLDYVLQQWHDERPDLDVSPMAVVGRLSIASRLIDTELARTFAAHGLDPAAFDVLATLRRSGPPYQLTPTDLMRSSMITSGGITQRLDRLEARSLITRSRSASDGRGVLVKLTQAGAETIDRALPDHLRTEKAILAGLSLDQRETLAATLRLLVAHLTATGATPGARA